MAQRESKPAVSRPVFVQKVSLNSLQAQRIKERVFDRTAIALYRTEVILRIIGDEAEATQVETIVAQLVEDLQKELDGEIERMKKLVKDHGISDLPSYTGPKAYDVEISSPQVLAFLGLLTGVDSLMGYIDALWLNKVLDNRQRSEATYGWQRRTLRLGRRIIQIELRAYRAAQNKGKDEEVRNMAGDARDIGNEDAISNEPLNGLVNSTDIADPNPAADAAATEATASAHKQAAKQRSATIHAATTEEPAEPVAA
jgi:hypothetical protein